MTPLALGDTATRVRVFSEADVAAYRRMSGDTGLRFGERRAGVPGPLVAGMISDLLGTELPGEGTMWMKQEMVFTSSAPLAAEVTARVEITRLRPDKGLVDLSCRCEAGSAVVLEGRSLVLVPFLAGRMA